MEPEGVDTKQFFPSHWSKVSGEVYGLMISEDLTGVKAVVVDEAKKAGKSAIIDAFMKKVSLRGKGGGTLIPQADGTFQGGRTFSGAWSCRSSPARTTRPHRRRS